MERLTDKREADAQRREYEKRLENGYPRNIPEERYLKLAAYEDTGRTPEEVKEHEAAYIEIMTRTYGPLRQKISQWLKAEKDGRLVVTPCKEGDPVWWISVAWLPGNGPMFYKIDSGKFRFAMLDWQNPIYTSQADAEAALEKMAKEGTTDEKSDSH